MLCKGTVTASFLVTVAVNLYRFSAYRSVIFYRYGDTDILRYHKFVTARRLRTYAYGRFAAT